MKSTMAVLLFVCLVAFFHSCYGINCYSCESNRNSNPKCNNLTDDQYLKKFPQNRHCTTLRINIFFKAEPGEIDGILRRSAYTSKRLTALALEIEKMKESGLEVDLKSCKEDGCNSA